MDKQLIESAATEVAHRTCTTYNHVGIERYSFSVAQLAQFAHAFLARIDAERGKSAAAEVAAGNYGNRLMWATEDAQVKSVPGDKLFLSPTPVPVPEGWALVPKHINYLDETPRPEVMVLLATPPKVGTIEEENDWYSRWWELLIAAAQGERNAD